MSIRSTLVKGVFEMLLVGIGVFLGMAADQWRTDQQHREQAREALRRFKIELENNSAAVANVKDYDTGLWAAADVRGPERRPDSSDVSAAGSIFGRIPPLAQALLRRCHWAGAGPAVALRISFTDDRNCTSGLTNT